MKKNSSLGKLSAKWLEVRRHHFGVGRGSQKGGHARKVGCVGCEMSEVLGLNRVRTKSYFLDVIGLPEDMASDVFSRISPIQHREDCESLYLESTVDKAIAQVCSERHGLSEPADESISEKGRPNMVALGGTDVLVERWADLLCKILERFVLKTQPAPVPETSQPSDRMLTPAEVAKILQIHVQTVMAWCREGKNLKGIKVGGNEANGKGGKWLIPREEVDVYLRRNRLINGKRQEGAK